VAGTQSNNIIYIKYILSIFYHVFEKKPSTKLGQAPYAVVTKGHLLREEIAGKESRSCCSS